MTELTITPLCSIFDLLLGIGLILLELSILAVIITIEIFYFRRPKKGESKCGKTVQQSTRPDRKHGAYARGVRFGSLQGIPGSGFELNHVQSATELQETMDAA